MVFSGNQPELYINEEIVDGVRTFICGSCGFNTNRKSSVARHQATVHAPKLDLKCEVCGVSYKNIFAFQEHLRRKKCNEFAGSGNFESFDKNS